MANRPGMREDLCWHHERRYTRVYEAVAGVVLAAVDQLGLPAAPIPARPAGRPAVHRAPHRKARLSDRTPGQADERRRMSA